MCILESERLILRPPRPADIQSMTVWLGDFDVARMTSRVPHPYGEGDAETFLALADEHRFVIERKSDGLFLGMTGLYGPDGREPGYEFGYWLGKPFWGFGYATEAASAALAFAFDRLGAARVPSRVFADNAASWNVQRKLGFTIVGPGKGFCLARNAEVDDLETVLLRERFNRQHP